jgi:hypothetical protein
VVTTELAELPPADLGPLGQVVLSPILRESVQTPLLRLPPDRVCFTFNLFRFPPMDRAVDAQRLVTANRTIYDRVIAADGTLYPVSAVPLSQAHWHTHFGPTFPQLSAAKRDYDPGYVLTPGYEVFSPPPA